MDKKWKYLIGVLVGLVVLSLIVVLIRNNKEEAAENGKASIAQVDKEILGQTVDRSVRYLRDTRKYLLHVPASYDGQTQLPLVIALHGGGHNAEKMEEMTGLSEKAEKEGFIVVYPEGVGLVQTWNAGFCCGKAKDDDFDDVGFVGFLISRLSDTYAIDDSRVFVTGVSNGGFLTHRIGAELSDKVRAIAPVAASVGDYSFPDNSVSVVMIHGKKDFNVPYDGGVGKDSISKVNNKSVEQAVDFWTEADGCANVASRRSIAQGVERSVFPGCDSGSKVYLYTLAEGEHEWPNLERDGFSATDTIWEFFESLN